MYMECRHIKTNGLRCKIRALNGSQFCYYHSRVHTAASLQLPVPEDPAAVQLSVARINNAILNGTLEVKKATALFYGLQIAAQFINRGEWVYPPDAVPSAEQNAAGDDLAPFHFQCDRDDECDKCPHQDQCTQWSYVDQQDDDDGGDEEDSGDDEDEDEEDEDDDEDDGDEDEDDEDDDEDEEDEDEDDEDEDEDEDEDDDEDDDGEDDGRKSTEKLVAEARFLASVNNAIDRGDMRLAARLLKDPGS